MEVDEAITQDKVEKPSGKLKETKFKRRDEFNKKIELHRCSAFDKNRFLENELVDVSEIKQLCARIKKKKRCSDEELEKLGNAFFQSSENISEFIKVTGAINVVIKEFLRNERKLLAAQTICNMSLGDEVCCNKVALFAGAYIIIQLKNISNVQLVKICLWTIQNLMTSGKKALEILMSQELLKSTTYLINNVADQEIKSEAIKVLDIILDKCDIDSLDINEIQQCICNHLQRNKSDLIALQSFYRILMLENYSPNPTMILDIITENIIKLKSDERIIDMCAAILLDISQKNPQCLSQFFEFFIRNDRKLSAIINEAIIVPKLFRTSKKLLSLLATLMSNPLMQQYFEFDNILQNLKIPRMFEQ